MPQKKKATKPKIKNVLTYKDLPKIYIGFRDDLDASIRKMEAMEENLISRGYRPTKPYDIYRLTTKENIYDKGKKRIKVKREVPSVMLAFKLEEIS